MADGKVEIDLDLNDKGVAEKAKKTGQKVGEGFETAAAGAGGKVSALSGKLKRLGSVAAGAFAVDKVFDFGKAVVETAAEVDAEVAAYEQIMGDYAGVASGKLKEVADNTGIAETRLTSAMTSMTAKFKGLGFGVEEATDLATRGLNIAADASAFWDMSLDETQSHLNSFINGSYEAGEAIGLFANDTQMAQYAIEQGIISSTAEWASLDEATKQATRLEYAENMMALSGATGQAAREADQYANVMANASENLRQFMAIVGAPIKDELVAPVMKELSAGLANMGEMLKSENFIGGGEALADMLANAVDAILQETPRIIAAGVEFVGGFVVGLIGAIPDVVVSIAGAITDLIPLLARALLSVVSALAAKLPAMMMALLDIIPTILPEFVASLIDGMTMIVETLVGALPEMIAIFAEQMPSVIESIVTSLVDNVDLLIQGFIQLFMSFLDAIPMIIEVIIANLPIIVVAIADALIMNIPILIQGFIQLFMSFVRAIPQIIASIIQALPQIVAAIVSGLIQAGSQLHEAAVSMFWQFVNGIGSMAGNAWSAAADVAANAVQAIGSGLSGMAEIGVNAIRGLVQGMGDMVGWAINRVQSFGSSIINGLKGFLGIHSPSTLLRDEIGKYMAMGIVEGFVRYDPMKAIEESFTVGIDKMRLASTMRSSGNVDNSQVINFNQPIQSPDEIARTMRMQRMYGLAGSYE